MSDRYPRLVTEAIAAKEVGLDLATFRHLVACGRLPKPRDEFGGRHDLMAIHAAIDRISGLEARDGGNRGSVLDDWKAGRA